YPRRLGALLVISLFHIVVIYWGDILMSYAITGFALLLFRRCSDRMLLIWAALLTFVPPIVFALPAVHAVLKPIFMGRMQDPAWKAQFFAAITGHDYGHLIRMQVRQAWSYLARVAIPSFPWILGRFLLGYLVGRRRLLAD